MKMAPLDIVDGSYADEDRSFSAQDTVNYLPTSAEQAGTRTPTILKTPPGLKPAVLIGVNEYEIGMKVAGPVRGTYNAEGRFFAVSGNRLFQISSAGIAIPLGTVPGVGRVSFSHNQVTNGNEILVNNGNAGYIYNTVTQVFQRITDTSYPGGLKAVFTNNRFVQIEPARRYAFNSALANGLEYTSLDRFTSETSPDLLMSIESIGNQLAAFSSTTTEWFEDTGASPQPFRSTGIVADKGAAGPFTTAKMDNHLFMLADDGVFYRLQGYNPFRISTKPIEQAIRGKNWMNAFTTVWEDSGFAVCYWTFPDGETWGYDASSGKWHRRESYGFNRWRLNSLTFWQNAWYGGDFQNGRLWRLDWDYLLEGDEEIVSSRAAGVISDNQSRVIHERLELVMNTGMEETVPVEFVDQPEGPTISGDAPDGLAGAPYSYAYSPTAGASPIVRTVLIGTELPEGWAWNQSTATLSSADPQAGTITLTIRTYDSSGLYAELSDKIDIAVATMGIGSSAISTYRTALSVAGDEWAITAADPGFSAGLLVPVSGTRFVAFNGTGGAVSYTDNFGASWVPSTGTFAGGGCPAGYAKNGVVIIGVTTAELVYRSADSGASFSPVTTANYWPNVPLFLTNSDVLVRENKTRNYLISADSFATFSVGMVSDIVISGRNCGFVHDGMAVFLGRSQANAKPAIAKSTTGLSETVFAFTDTVANHISAGCTNGSMSEPMWVVATSGGEFYWSDDLGISWTKSTYVTPSGVPVSALSWNGVRFVAGTGVNLVQTTALILNSNLGRNDWDEVTNPLAANVFGISCIPVESP